MGFHCYNMDTTYIFMQWKWRCVIVRHRIKHTLVAMANICSDQFARAAPWSITQLFWSVSDFKSVHSAMCAEQTTVSWNTRGKCGAYLRTTHTTTACTTEKFSFNWHGRSPTIISTQKVCGEESVCVCANIIPILIIWCL